MLLELQLPSSETEIGLSDDQQLWQWRISAQASSDFVGTFSIGCRRYFQEEISAWVALEDQCVPVKLVGRCIGDQNLQVGLGGSCFC